MNRQHYLTKVLHVQQDLQYWEFDSQYKLKIDSSNFLVIKKQPVSLSDTPGDICIENNVL
jgi:hypothetical protein